MSISKILSRYPIIYLMLFCFGSLLFGFEVSHLVKYGFPVENFDFYLSLSSVIFNAFLTIYFFYCFVKVKKKQKKDNLQR